MQAASQQEEVCFSVKCSDSSTEENNFTGDEVYVSQGS